MSSDYEFVEPEGDQCWDHYAQLAQRCFGHPVADITLLRERASVRLAVRGGRVVGGGLGLAVHQHFGGAPVAAACLGAGCVAPEERGNLLARQLMDQPLRALREIGDVAVATIWTSSNGYARRLGWQAPVPVLAHTVTTEDLRATFTRTDHQITCDLDGDGRAVQRDLAAEWNGPVLRPDWWWAWKNAKSGLISYQFRLPGGPVGGVLTLATERREPRGMNLVVHDFWATGAEAAEAMLAFLGSHHSRCEAVQFRRAALPPYPALLHGLNRYRVIVQAWHPWMLRILDVPAALRQRGWPVDTELATVIEVRDPHDATARRYRLYVADGTAQVDTTTAEPAVRFTRCQLATWYAGGYPSPAAARFDGVTASPRHLTAILACTAGHQPWLPDLF